MGKCIASVSLGDRPPSSPYPARWCACAADDQVNYREAVGCGFRSRGPGDGVVGLVECGEAATLVGSGPPVVDGGEA